MFSFSNSLAYLDLLRQLLVLFCLANPITTDYTTNMSHSNGIRLFDAGPDFFLLLLSAIYLHHPLKTGHNTTATDKFPPECWILVDWANWVWMVVVGGE